MMDISEDNVQMLMSMGFPYESEVRRALRIAKNDLNEAVAILANDHPSSSYDTLDDVEMRDVHRRSTQPVYGPHPPGYDDAVEAQNEGEAGCSGAMDDSGNLEFPVTNLYELEGRVFTELWNIPYKKEESLGRCLIAATKLAQAGLTDSDEHCKRFMERCMPEAFQKLLTSAAVHKWSSEIQEGIFDMLQLMVELVVARLHHTPVPIPLLDSLNLAFNSDTEFQQKNRSRRDRVCWEEKIEGGQPLGVSPANSYKDPYGWLTHLINKFAEQGGMDEVKRCLESEELDAPSMAAILRPFGTCAEFLSSAIVQKLFAPGMEKAIKYIQGLEEKDFKEKKIGSVSDLLTSMKLLCISVWPHDVDNLDELRLDIALRMLQSPHFNARMNSLKEVTKMIDDSNGTKMCKTAMRPERVLDWLVDCKILSIALEGNIDQAQYCDKIKGLVDFLGSKLSLDELTMIWKMQNGQTNNVIDNIHSIMAAAAVKFEPQQLEHLFRLIQKKWQDDSDRMREKLLSLIGKIGKDARVGKTTTRVLELLWDLSHLPALSTHLIEQALEEHHAILSDSYSVKEQIKLQYVIKCVDDIKKGAFVLPALRQLIHISKNIIKQSFHKADKGVIHELNKNCDVIKLVSGSLVKCHKSAVGGGGDGQLTESTIVDGRYTHADYMTTHLYFLQYVLQEGVLYLPWGKARDVWTTMVANPKACDWDRETCYEWFSKGLTDLEAETQNQLFQKEILRLDPAKLSEKGFTCFKCFFESVNLYEHKLKRSGNTLIVEKQELLGCDYLWEICLRCPDENIAHQAIQLLLSMAYANLSPRIKKEPVCIHKKFIAECYKRLETAMIGIGGSVVAQTVSNATKLLTAAIVPEVANVPLPSKSVKLVAIERLLWIAEAYVLSVEEMHYTPRSIPPHGASFHGYQMNIFITCEALKQEFMLLCHSNENLGSVRVKVSERLQQQIDHIQIVANDKPLQQGKDQKLLHQLEFEDNQLLQVRLSQSGSTSSTASLTSTSTYASAAASRESSTTPTSKQTFDLEQEKMLPGYVMAIGGQVFEMLYQLTELDEPKITKRVRKLLMLIPTDPGVVEILDSISGKGLKQSSSSDDVSTGKSSPRKSPNSTLSNSSRLSPKDLLTALFDVTGPDMSAFRVLYNLEVVSGKLMPTSDDAGSRLSSQSFCEDFLTAGGLSLVVRVLQPESLPNDTNYEIRQGCYSVCLQLARYLLCGQTVTGDDVDADTPVDGATGGAAAFVSASPGHAVSVQSTTSAGSRTVKTLSSGEFMDTVSCFMKVAWAAAAGRLHLLSYNHPIRESRDTYSCGHRSRQSSNASSASTNSDSDCQSLHAGVCAHQISIPTKDSNIAKEALEILVTCLQLRAELIGSFYSLSCVSDFVMDLLVGCPQTEIRVAAMEQLFLISEISLTPDSTLQPPHQFMLQLLLRAYLPFWVASSNTRGSSQKLLNQCGQYFDLRCRLLEGLSKETQTSLQVDPAAMLEDEMAWLTNFVPSKNPELHQTNNTLMAGHLKLIRTLLTCEGVDKEEIGVSLVEDLLHDFLFPASKLMMDSLNQSNAEMSLAEFNPKCSNSESRVAAYELLTELVYATPSNLRNVCRQLLQMHHQHNPDSANEWEYMPPVDGRAACGYVGLKNAGATCYMNSVLQQLYMIPGVPEAVLGVEEDHPEDETVFYQMQQIFGHMMESRLQYHEPEKFWSVFKLWGQTINVREQQDAFDFFQAIIDQVDEHMKKTGKDEIFKKKFQGIFSDQKICKDCPHRYEREEAFIALNLTVKNATLQDSLDQFVKGELLEGDNSYFCEKCGEKRNTIKRMCIKTLPPLLCIQLKRFGYDWETNRALKFDDYFRFPWMLDMEPYTAEGMARREVDTTNTSDSDMTHDSVMTNNVTEVTSDCSTLPHRAINYELVGVVVHSGQANAGHYYSFIRERRGTYVSNGNKGKWYKFNDTVVEECDMSDLTLEQECFGGSYKAKVFDQSTSAYPEDRLRYWNGYLLFYERVEEPQTPVTAKKSKIVKKVLPEGGKRSVDSDSLMELTELVHKGERRGMFMDKMPASIQQIIHAENVTFVKNRDVYNHEYFRCVKNLVSKNAKQEDSVEYSSMCIQCLHLALRFLFNTYLRNRRKTMEDLTEWVDLVDLLVTKSKETCMWMVDYFASKEGFEFIKPFLLECPNRDVRTFMARLLDRLISAFFSHSGVPTQKSFDSLIEQLLSMLEKDAVDQAKHCAQYFTVLRNYVLMGTKACSHMFGRQGFRRLVTFLLGQNSGTDNQDCTSRRWSSIQSREFVNLHVALAVLIANCDVAAYRTEDCTDFPPCKPKTVSPNVFLKMPVDMEKYVFGSDSFRYLREVVHAVRELIVTNATITDMLVYCSFCNKPFSLNLVKSLMMQYLNTPSNELKPIFTLLTEMLVLEDALQLTRLKWVIDGHTDESGSKYEGLIATIRLKHVSDSRRSYQCIKFLVSVSSQCAVVKDYLMKAPSKWQWAVNWLKKKMTEHYWSTSTSAGLSNEDSNRKSFQRTQSAQYTLQEATALLTELENCETGGGGAEVLVPPSTTHKQGDAFTEGSSVQEEEEEAPSEAEGGTKGETGTSSM